MGFINYLFSVPIIFIALEIHQRILKKTTFNLLLICFLLISLLFLSHPYAVLVYIVLATILTLTADPGKKLSGLAAPLVVLVIFSIWYGFAFEASAMLPYQDLRIRWWSPLAVLQYFFLPFFGMQPSDESCYLNLILWLVIAVLFIYSSHRNPGSLRDNISVKYLLIATLAGYSLMPFWLGDYSYFNLRMSIICYFLIALMLNNIPIGRKTAELMVATTFLLMTLTIGKNISISKEIELLIPIFNKMDGNQTLLPIYFESNSSELDRSYFYEFLAHSHFYYHIEKGGGTNPGLFNSTMNPIKVVDGLSFSDVENKPELYRYVLIYGDIIGKDIYSSSHRLSMGSGKWKLFEREKYSD
jgi:hypothetical protein